ncbi:CLUMA_CG013537, isoform A [Clunio marinus]|uniref:CLUMA_CG013537, isoform A n=1 Tax=Clunio marinus TaxID=568069 RepID=A0A1J1IJ87_9DIPT|nr:CLUMA_CG013537, isoform A [Clunio marinus]
MALKFNIASIAVLVLITISADPAHCGGGGDGGHKTVKIEVPYKIHTIHHHHTEKFPVYKKIEVPVIKEVKVPYPVHVPVKVPYPVVVKPHVVTVPVHHYPVHSETHQHHESHHESHGEGGHEEGGHGGHEGGW